MKQQIGECFVDLLSKWTMHDKIVYSIKCKLLLILLIYCFKTSPALKQ